MALGALRGDVVRMILGESLRIAAFGLAVQFCHPHFVLLTFGEQFFLWHCLKCVVHLSGLLSLSEKRIRSSGNRMAWDCAEPMIRD
jgi:hypothetical protein